MWSASLWVSSPLVLWFAGATCWEPTPQWAGQGVFCGEDLPREQISSTAQGSAEGVWARPAPLPPALWGSGTPSGARSSKAQPWEQQQPAPASGFPGSRTLRADFCSSKMAWPRVFHETSSERTKTGGPDIRMCKSVRPLLPQRGFLGVEKAQPPQVGSGLSTVSARTYD